MWDRVVSWLEEAYHTVADIVSAAAETVWGWVEGALHSLDDELAEAEEEVGAELDTIDVEELDAIEDLGSDLESDLEIIGDAFGDIEDFAGDEGLVMEIEALGVGWGEEEAAELAAEFYELEEAVAYLRTLPDEIRGYFLISYDWEEKIYRIWRRRSPPRGKEEEEEEEEGEDGEDEWDEDEDDGGGPVQYELIKESHGYSDFLLDF